MKKILLFFFLLFFWAVPKTFAADKFSTSYAVVYDVSQNGNTRVTSSVQLKNNTSDFYVSKYSIKTGFKNISNISVRDEGGDVRFNSIKTDTGTLISFTFNQNTVGVGKIQKFTVSYDTPEIAKSTGKVWEINVPGFAGQEDYQSFSAEIKVPDSFGKASIIKPATPDSKVIGQNNLIFSKKDLGRSGISVYFGDYQVYNFDLSYHLYNKNILPVTSEIALPSTNNYQDVLISDISPRPDNVYIDKDGNWMAKFKLSPGGKENIRVVGSSKIYYSPRKETLSEENRNLLTQPQKYWEVNDPKVVALAKKLKTPQAIFNYVVSNLKYDSGRVGDNQVRAGAAGVLLDKNSAVCLEFTDLFVALSRAAGIPAREVEGFANTSNSANRPLSLEKDVLHAWPEYYDSRNSEWVMVDPTWQNTTGGTDYFNVFDFDHFGFVINGQNSNYPVPAGGYKIAGQDSQDVVVVAGKTFPQTTPQLTANLNVPEKQIAGLHPGGKILVTNESGVILPKQKIQVTSTNVYPRTQTLYLDAIPPYGKRAVSFGFDRTSALTNANDQIKIMIGKSVISADTTISPFYKSPYFYVIGGVLIGIITIAVFAITRRSRRISVS